MDNTCSKECPLWKKYKDKCPNYIQTTWTNEKGEVKLIEDCAPKRTMLMLQEVYNRLVGVEKSQEQQRNEFSYFTAIIKNAMQGANNANYQIGQENKSEIS